MTEAIYFLETPTLIKVGYSKQFKQRIKQLRRGCLEQISVLGTISAGRSVEQEIHYRLKAHKVKGEWFQKNEETLALCHQILRGELKDLTGLVAKPLAAKDGDSPAAIAYRLARIASVFITEALVEECQKFKDPEILQAAANFCRAFKMACFRAEKAEYPEELDAISEELEDECGRASAALAIARRKPHEGE